MMFVTDKMFIVAIINNHNLQYFTTRLIDTNQLIVFFRDFTINSASEENLFVLF